MKTLVVCGIALLSLGVGRALAAVPLVDKLAALEQKLHGKWAGQGPCDGQLTIHANGTYEWARHGPGGNNSAGTWAVQWDALPPTLVLICKTSDSERYRRRTGVKLVELDDAAFAFKYPEGQQRPTRFARLK